MKKHYDLAVYIGRFQPLHAGHEHVIREGQRVADRVLVLVGDTGGPRTVKNPWTAEERGAMIEATFPANHQHVYWDWVQDHPNDTVWINNVREAVEFFIDDHVNLYGTGEKKLSIVLIGHEKDLSSKYLRWFAPWDFYDVGFANIGGNNVNIDATTIRDFYFQNRFTYVQGVLSERVLSLINHFETFGEENRIAFAELHREYDYIQKYKRSWETAPYAPTFVTTDAVVIQSGNVLMIKRGGQPGKGQMALPGGFADVTQRLEDSMLRELKEETGIKLQEDTLRRCIKHSQVFDDPGRSLRGRTITHAFLIKLNDASDLPKVVGADDADEAMWVPINELDPRNCFEDHYHIITAMMQYV